MQILRRERSALQRALERAHDPQVLSLALGLPAPEMFPSDELGIAAGDGLLQGRTALQYGIPEQRLKGHVVELMRRRGVECAEDEIILTTGAQQGLSLLAQLLLPGTENAIMVEEAVYPGFRQAVEPYCPTLVPIPIDLSCGIDIETAERVLRNRPRPAFLYTMSAGHNPLSLTMSADARQALVDLSLRHDLPIVEDDVYGFLQYDECPAPPLCSLSRDSVFYVGSFSKILAPALRIGWIVAPRDCITTLSVLKEGSDINTGTLAQRIVCRYLDSYSLPDHIERLRSEYKVRRDAMHAALLKSFPSGVHWRRPSAGFYFWVESDSFGDTTELLEDALKQRVAFLPGAAFSVASNQQYNRAMRLNFSHCCAQTIHQAVTRIATIVQERSARPLAAAG